MQKHFHCNILAMLKGKKKESECFVAVARSAGDGLVDYDVVRKHFD